MLRTDSKVVSG
jgi:hypothetical protein